MKKKITLKDILILQAVIAIYTLSTVMAKLASGHPTLSLNFFLFYGAELAILAIYALLWQQMIKNSNYPLPIQTGPWPCSGPLSGPQ